ncbi:hypothetical protein [Chamaesiphon sp.]|uniref:hypothetical protein n=1 Tax=Chamaesiphon sp. TaxID=2814140 RepID=UPI003593D79D
MKQFIKSLFDRRELYRVIETDRRGQELMTLYYIYKTNLNFLPMTRLYLVIKDGEYYVKYGKCDITHGNSTYQFPSGISTYIDSDWLYVDKVATPNTLKEIAAATLDTLAAEIVKIIQFDVKIQDESVVANDVERKLLQAKRAELWSEYHNPFQITLGSLFARLEKERAVLEGHLSPNMPEISSDVSLLLNTEIGSDYSERQLKVNNLLESFKELD